MSTSTLRRSAEQSFEAGSALAHEGRYEQALIELRRAEEGFRRLDAPGRPFGCFLENGVSGLANTLALSGRCNLSLGRWDKAAVCFETSFINERFERPSSFPAFVREVEPELVEAYARLLDHADPNSLQTLITGDPIIDTAFRFPYSLDPEALAQARLYELAPGRYHRFRDFHARVRGLDLELRKSERKPDEAGLRKAGLIVALALGALLGLYALVGLKALLLR
jgi:hypothetical protein